MSKVDSILVPIFATDGPGYEVDFCAWSEEQGRRLRTLRIPGLDFENLAEEIESLSRSDKRRIKSRLAVLLLHLLKWRYHPARSGQSWLQTIREQRREIESLLEESPSVRPLIAGFVTAQYRRAVADAPGETGLAPGLFPPVCEWTPEQVLSEAYFPNPAG